MITRRRKDGLLTVFTAIVVLCIITTVIGIMSITTFFTVIPIAVFLLTILLFIPEKITKRR